MEICHVSPSTTLYQKHPKLFEDNSRIVVRNTDVLNFKVLKKLSRTGKEIILWYDTPAKNKQVVVNLAAKIGCRKVIYPVSTLKELHQLENLYGAGHLKFVATITTNSTERDYLLVLGGILRSRKIVGVGFDWTHMVSPFQHLSLPLFAIRPRVLTHANILFGLALYNKEYYCLRSNGVLAEIMLLANFGFIDALVTDVALTLAKAKIKMDDENRLPTDFGHEFTQEHHIDDFHETFEVVDEEYALIKYNIKTMQEHNNGDNNYGSS